MQRCSVEKKMLFIACWSTYVITYLCRVNFSSVMARLSQEMQIGSAQLGVVGSTFFSVYAAGQLINGYLGDKISPYRFVTIAMIGTGLLNLAISQIHSYGALLVFWTINGYFQSMMWGPLMRILSLHFNKAQTAHISTLMSTSMVVGYITSWAVFGRWFLSCSWQTYFFVPSLLALLAGAAWAMCTHRIPILERHGPSVKKGRNGFLHIFRRERLWLVALVCLCMGLIKESLSLWAPLLLSEMLGLEMNDSLLLVLIIPMANFLGILFSGHLMRRENNVKKVLFQLFVVAALCSAGLLATQGFYPGAGVLGIGIVSGLMYGCNSLLLSYLPISFGGENIVSTLVGLFDFSSYMGAALSSILLGAALETHSYSSIFAVWLAVLALAGCLTFFFHAKDMND